jgi:hypothetical protein
LPEQKAEKSIGATANMHKRNAPLAGRVLCFLRPLKAALILPVASGEKLGDCLRLGFHFLQQNGRSE